MNNNLTEIVFILDRSGSMSGLESDTIGGFNGMLKKQLENDGDALVSTLLFDNECEVIHDRIDIRQIPELTSKEYFVRGCTALLDAVGGAIHHIGNIHKYARKEDVPAHTLFIITTDGMENASHRYSAKKVKQMIENQKSKYGWEFIFLGANIDAVETASNIGIAPEFAVDYRCDKTGTAIVYNAISNVVTNMRSGEKLSKSWRKAVDEDYQSRR